MFGIRKTTGLVLSAALLFGLLTASGRVGAQTPKVHPPSALEIGKVAPDIEGVDTDGVKFKLSDYRGKVIVLDFWGDW